MGTSICYSSQHMSPAYKCKSTYTRFCMALQACCMTKAQGAGEHRLELNALHQQSTPAGVRNAMPSASVFVTPECALLMQSLQLRSTLICPLCSGQAGLLKETPSDTVESSLYIAILARHLDGFQCAYQNTSRCLAKSAM